VTKYKLNFRSTIGSWGEVAPSGAVLGDRYPSIVAGLTCGWGGTSANTANYNGATNAELSGRNSVNGSGAHFRVDLPLGPGTYRLWLALSALSSTTNSAFIVRDGDGPVITTVPSTNVPGSGIAASASVLDASGAVVSYSQYISTDGGTYIEFTTANDYIRIERNAITLYLCSLMIEAQETPLGPAALSTQFGTGVHAGAIYPKEPNGFRFGRISSTVGLQSYAIISGSPYFAIEVDGSSRWLTATSTRIPDNWSGVVTVRQSSGSQTQDTSFLLTASALSRPTTGVYGGISSETLVERAAVKGVLDAECWAGYTGQSLASDQVVTDLADFVSKFNALPETGWHRLRLQDGAYSGDGSILPKDWVANGGGVVIQPDAGHDPLFRARLQQCRQRGVHWHGVRMSPMLGIPRSHGIFMNALSAPYPVYRFSSCRMGHGFAPGWSVSEWGSWANILNFSFCEEVTVVDCDIVGVWNGFVISGGRRMRFLRNNFQKVVSDYHALTTAYRFNTPRGVFPDDITYVEISDSNAWDSPDVYDGLTTATVPHSDWIQVRRTGGAAYPTTSPGVNGSSTMRWSVGVVGYVAATDRLYTVVAVTGDALIDPSNPPSGTGTGIVSGNVTFDYLMEYTLATDMLLLMENNCILQDGLSQTTTGGMPNVQFIINSNSGWKNNYRWTVLNNICGSANTRGIDGGTNDSHVHAEFNSFVGGATKSRDNNQSAIRGNIVRARKNIVGYSGSLKGVFITHTTAFAGEGNVIADFTSSSVNPPGDVMRGAFVDYGPGVGWGYAMVDDDTITGEQFRSEMSKQMHHTTGDAGARLREVHLISVGSEDYSLVINEQ
jgi:hypothetical protein